MFVEHLHSFLPQPAAEVGAFGALTEREKGVLHLLARGLDNTEIGLQLAISEKTVRNHVSGIFAKLSVESRARAVAVARDAGYGN